MTKLKRPERYVQFESIKPELKEITEFYTRKTADYQYRLKQLNEYADALENEISVLKETPKVEVLLDYIPKPLVVVPRRFADWFEEKMAASFLSVVSAYSFSDDEDIKWVRDNGGLDLLCKMKLYGYTVEKEQLYHVVLPEAINCYLNFRTNNGDAMFGSSEEIGNYKTRFTEQEIKALDERYWQFAVPVDEVE